MKFLLTEDSACDGNCQQGKFCDCVEHPEPVGRGFITALLLSIFLWALIGLGFILFQVYA